MLQANLRIAQMTAEHGPERKPKSRQAGRRLTGGATLVEAAWKGGPCGCGFIACAEHVCYAASFSIIILFFYYSAARRESLYLIDNSTKYYFQDCDNFI